MLDIKLIRSQPEMVKSSLAKKGILPAAIDRLLQVDADRRRQQQTIDELRSKRKELGLDNIDLAKQLKSQLEILQEEQSTLDRLYQQLILDLPNLPAEDVPVGEGESANTVIRSVGTLPTITSALDHVLIAKKYDLIDIERSSKVSGSRFNFLKNQAVWLELALVRLAFETATRHGFTPMIPPVLVNEQTVVGTGYLPQGEDEVYKTDDNLYLTGTSEQSLMAYHAGEILLDSELPRRYVAFSTCFRREAGTYGRDTRGIIRQHQFDKVELVSLVQPEQSRDELLKVLAIEEELVASLGLPYQVVAIGTGDLGVQAAQKFDIETWMPAQAQYRETHSCSNTTDFQTRRLNIRYVDQRKDQPDENRFLHSVNGTAIAIGRMLIAILENGQQPDGSIAIPSILHPYLSFKEISQLGGTNENNR